MQRLLDSGDWTRSTVGTHLILDLIRRLRGSGFAGSELSRDEPTNAAYRTTVTYCIQHTAGVVELMNLEGLRSWLEETLGALSGRLLFVSRLWALADWTLEAVMTITPAEYTLKK